MADHSVIGPGAFVRGRLTGASSVEVRGRVEGDIDVSGDVSVEGSGLIAANVAGRRIVVRGAVKGDLTATEAIEMETGARVVGDVRAPRISIAPGALVRGFVTTGAREEAASRRASPAATSRPAPSLPAARLAETAPRTAPSAPKAQPARAPETKARPSMSASRVPPLPVVPTLKKGAKAVQKKR
jgi:cytoskeletal protein CcmA (bactofilin family)